MGPLPQKQRIAAAVGITACALILLARAAEEGTPTSEPPGAARDPAFAVAKAQAVLQEQSRATEQAIRRALQKELTIDFEERPLHEALRTLAERGGFPLWIDGAALTEERVQRSEPVSGRLVNVSIDTALHRILPQFGLSWYIEDEVLKVTTNTNAYDEKAVRTYNISRLLHLAAEAERASERASESGTADLAIGRFIADSERDVDREQRLVDLLFTLIPENGNPIP